MGTRRSVNADFITIEVRDNANGMTRTERLFVTKDTKFREGKTPVSDPSPYIGTRIVAAVDLPGHRNPIDETEAQVVDVDPLGIPRL